MSCQPHGVTSGQSNLGHKQTQISKLFSHIYQPSVKSIYRTNHFVNIKHTQTSDTNFQRVSPLNITPVKRAQRRRKLKGKTFLESRQENGPDAEKKKTKNRPLIFTNVCKLCFGMNTYSYFVSYFIHCQSPQIHHA